MEKSKKSKKVEKTVKEVTKEESIILGNSEKKLINFGALLIAFFASGLAILIFVFSVISTLSIANMTNDALVDNNIVVTMLSKMNNNTVSEVKELLSIMENRVTVIVFDVIIPAIAFIGAMLLLIVFAKRIIEFVKDVQTEKDLFNDSKVRNLQDLISIFSIVLLAMLVLFNEPSIIFYLLIEVLLGFGYLLFKKCVSLMKR